MVNRLILFDFFFSSRRRHTMSKRDWSSDVCSSDLQAEALFGPSPVLDEERTLHGAPHPAAPQRGEGTAWEHYALGRALLRSEERRVGKEGSYCWSRPHSWNHLAYIYNNDALESDTV